LIEKRQPGGETIELSAEVLSNVKFIQEKKLIGGSLSTCGTEIQITPVYLLASGWRA